MPRVRWKGLLLRTRALWLASHIRPLRPWVLAYYDRRVGDGWTRRHPFDVAHGVETSGMLPGFVIRPGDSLASQSTAYAGSQPSIVRRVLETIPNPERCAFVDLGCGKGRPLIVASEFPFRAIVGVELFEPLADKARHNAATIAAAHPERTPIEVVCGDALAHPWPDGDLILFLYHPFQRPLMERLLRRIEMSIEEAPRALYIIYYNPVWAELIDASSALARRHAEAIAYDASEIGFGPDTADSVVIWRRRDGVPCPVETTAARRVVVTIPNTHADVVG